VTLGQVIGDRVVVRDGLEPGDLVVSLGHSQLTDNARVSIKNLQETPSEDVDADR
jgi:multidrug efflux pump subunit AcrA (membrane-fusion protein)